jgi:hypothetical protein
MHPTGKIGAISKLIAGFDVEVAQGAGEKAA